MSNLRKKGQVTIFVIVAIVLIAAVILYFVARSTLPAENIPSEFSEIYTYYEQCIGQQARAALELAGSNGGYVDDTQHFPGSEYAPFSSHLNFLGLSVPYWYYVAGNGIIKEQVPTRGYIEKSVAGYIARHLSACNFDAFYERGFSLTFEEPEVRVSIEDVKVTLDVTGAVTSAKEDRVARKTIHRSEVSTRFGKFYNEALKIYEKEKHEAFLENYSVDVLRLYAPVDGVEVSCSPKIWKARDVVNELYQALEANIGAIQLKSNSQRTYFTVDYASDIPARFLYLQEWPSRVNIEGTDGELMIAEPLGNQEGMGILGFCYAPYHFVYDLSFPVLIQLYDEQEIFQFPVVAVIDKNLPREGISSELESEDEQIDLCRYKTNEVTIKVYDSNLTPTDAQVTYGCFSERCTLGTTQNGVLTSQAPGCLNGYLYVQAEGYAAKKQLFSSSTERQAEVIIEREYPVAIKITLGGKPLDGSALVTFNNGERVQNLLVPEMTALNLSEGLYNISIYVYENSSITIPETTKQECRDTPQRGLLGFFGSTKRECFDITIPETKIEHALAGGGVGQHYFLPNQLAGGTITLEAEELPKPTSLAELQTNYEAFDGLRVNAEFRS